MLGLEKKRKKIFFSRSNNPALSENNPRLLAENRPLLATNPTLTPFDFFIFLYPITLNYLSSTALSSLLYNFELLNPEPLTASFAFLLISSTCGEGIFTGFSRMTCAIP